ncbi:Fusaric acid resistance protein-like protein [Clostridioides difficile]|uniref:FUSC family protein n=1 Tax=unclassified Clostridioides TaxID=2635829 RepID=UPI001D1077BD|nr:FUSC family protein [Clostridioides sp. ZZV14-6150]MCC0741433.1 FUSC family protein [Clostridioides sp. ZZV14-6044]MCC0750128.1 FUSC family protein [Clostridioides sp. ZZV13-5731]WLD28548.1 Fusaric acid resistance protein-like protein [Clostridioides difficile]
MTKKLIISKTKLFIFIIAFISAFIALFGSKNTLIGVAIVTAMLMLLERDLTISPIKNLLKYLIINVTLGVLSFFAVQNMYLGILLNFIALFIIGYLFSYDLKRAVYVPFGLMYIFMISIPVGLSEFPIRLSALASGSLVIMIAQFVMNRNRMKKIGDKELISICDELLEKINLLKNIMNNDNSVSKSNMRKIDSCNYTINSISKGLKMVIFDNRKDDFFISIKGMDIINILFSLERISLILDRYKADTKEFEDEDIKNILEESSTNGKEDVLVVVSKEVNYIKMCLENKDNITDKEILGFRDYVIAQDTKNINLKEIYSVLENLYEFLLEYKKVKSKEEKRVERKIKIPHEFKRISIYKQHFNLKSIRFSYAIKIALATAISGFIMDYFHLKDGRWIMLTVFSLTQPYAENCLQKSRKRIEGTLVGAIIFIVSFSIIKDNTLRSLIVLLAGYINSYVVDYRKLIVCVTVSALGSAAVMGDPNVLTMSRISYVVLGAIIALIINKFVLPYDAKMGYQHVIDVYKGIVKNIINEVNKSIENSTNVHYIKNLLLVPSLIEDRLMLINTIYKDECQDDFLENQQLLISNMYNLYINVKKNNIRDEDVERILRDTSYISNYDADKYDEGRSVILDSIENTVSLGDKIICLNLLQTLNGVKEMYRISNISKMLVQEVA